MSGDIKIVGLKGPAPGQSAPNVVELIQELLREAQEGKIVTFGAVTVDRRGVIGTAFATSGADHAHHLVAAAAYLQRRAENNVLDD